MFPAPQEAGAEARPAYCPSQGAAPPAAGPAAGLEEAADAHTPGEVPAEVPPTRDRGRAGQREPAEAAAAGSRGVDERGAAGGTTGPGGRPVGAGPVGEERTALAWLSALAEPGDVTLRRLIDALGAVDVLAAIRAERAPEPRALVRALDARRHGPREFAEPGYGAGALPATSADAGPVDTRPGAQDDADTETGGGAVRRPASSLRGKEPGRAAAIARALSRWRTRLAAVEPGRALEACDRLGGRFVIPGDPEWPTQLDDLGDARPYGLWLRGGGDLRFACLRSVALVGARAASDYGLHVAVELAGDLAEAQWSVVSGGAYGVDARAHRGALAEHGTTVAVLACGMDVAYPSSHAGLFEEIAANGVIVSEWPPGARPYRGRFLVRNRVIAALTRGTVVVEAALRSGALSTARHARDLSRQVMAVPGPITSQTSAGCHRILREWDATCVTSAAEVIEQIGLIGDDLAAPRRPPVLPRDRLDDDARRVLDALPARGPGLGPATIAAESGTDLDTTVSCLGRLAAAGFAERSPAGWRLRPP